ncbi:Uncharacterised protein [Mycobacteroides abscessus subsp. abscessus]|nr:Uncharacterised protein [Mycobacteroides abscessus subsp. abscessus]SIL10826.1 Uncharacterised protein [Mycobacteroides abscessus subsp. abscessus]
MAYVEMVGRLVEYQHMWLLGQGTGDQYSLALTTRK